MIDPDEAPDDHECSASPEALEAVRTSAEALTRAARITEVDVPQVYRRNREISISNGLVWAFKQALGVSSP